MQVVIGASPVTVTELGRIVAPGNSGIHTVKLVNAGDGTDVAGGAVAINMSGGTAGQFQYGSLSSPVTLAAGTAYHVVSQENVGGDSWYDWDTEVATTEVAADNGPVYGVGPGSWFSLGWANQAYVPVSFKYVRALPTVTVVATDPVAGESGTTEGAGVFTFTRTGSTNSALTVSFGVTGTATAGQDYIALGNKITFNAGSATATTALIVLNNDLRERDASTVLTLSSGPDYDVGSPASAVATIRGYVLDLWPSTVPDKLVGIGPERLYMSPGGGPQQVEVTEPTLLITDVSTPTITVCRPAIPNDAGTAIIICPGGGYWDLYWQLEGAEVATWLNSLGVTGIILKYRVPRGPEEGASEPARRPLEDAQRAVSLVRSKASEWGIDPQRIGIIGFSAGGHLAIATATTFDRRTYQPQDDIDQVNCRPDFAIAAYPGYLVASDTNALAPYLNVPAGTPPTFLVHGDDDIVAPPQNSVCMYSALKQASVSCELLVYADSVHDFGVRTNAHPCSAWTKACESWLRHKGLLITHSSSPF